MRRILIRLFFQGVKDLGHDPWPQIFSVAGVSLVAFLSGLFLIALTTLDAQLGMVKGETAFQVYWHQGADMPQVREQWQAYEHMPGFQKVKTFTPDEALKELGQKLGRTHAQLERGFPFLADKNPLPATALVYFAPPSGNLESFIEGVISFLEAQPGVLRVVTTPLHDELGIAWRKVSHYVMWPSVAFLTLVLGLVVGNTVRLSLLTREHEIEILRLVGARNWYIRMPLVVSGTIIGLAGGLIALILLVFVHTQLRDALNFPPLLMEILFLPWPLSTALVLVPGFTGAAASWLAVRD